METIALLRQTSKSQERLHSSQLPPEKPNLTKGVTVENIVKRLSSERHTSPPPAQIVRDGFSYTRPGEPIVYAQVVLSNEGKEKHTVRNQYVASDEEVKQSSPINLEDDGPRMAAKEYLTMKRPSPPLPKYTLDETDNFPRTKFKPYNISDEDEGLGIDYSKRFSTSYIKTSTGDSFTNSDEDHITPTVKYTAPERLQYATNSYSANYRGQADGKEYLPEFHELSQRREILQSRFRNRIGSRELLDKASPDRDLRAAGNSRYENYHQHGLVRRSVDRMASESPVRRRTMSPPPVEEERIQRKNAKNQYVETFVTKTVINRDGKPYAEEFVERFKYPSKNVEDVKTTRTTFERDGSVERTEVQNFTRNLQDNSIVRHDKGDSGIENDFRKDSFSSEFPTGRKFTLMQNIQACEGFIRSERAHTTSCLRKPRRVYSHRERSIDDGSRYDPRLDEYATDRDHPLKSSLKQEKKIGGLAKVKQFMSSTKKKLVKMGESDKKDSRHGSVRGEDRLRYDEQFNSKVPDIATRRRLSTPKSSPSITKRSLSFKSAKTGSGSETKTSRSDWFKSFDRLSRKKSDAKSQLSDAKSGTSGAKQQKSLRFFGDTDNELGDQAPYRPSRSKSSLSKVDKRYQSAYDLEATPKIRETRYRSTSMQNLDEDVPRNDSKRKDLYDISEHSTSYSRMHSPSPAYPPRRQHSMSRDYTPERSANRKGYSRSRENSVDLLEAERYHQRSRSEQQHRKPPAGPQKPARSFERGGSLTREDRIHDSSGTEGESSQQSQRSVVFLHATTVGDIPHPHIANARRMAFSRESLNNPKKPTPPQPMTRTISRSISVLAPWKPKHIRDGYEINYHNDQQQQQPQQTASRPVSTLPRPLKNRSHSQSTLSRTKQKTRRSHTGSKDDLDSDKSSSFENSRTAYGGGTLRTGGGHQTHSLPRRPREGGSLTAAQSSSSRTNTLQKHRRI